MAHSELDSSQQPSLDVVLQSSSTEALKAAGGDPGLSEDLALTLLQRSDLAPEVLDLLSKNASVIKSRKAKLAILGHPKTPRYVSVVLLRQLFPFDLMKVGLMPAVAGDIKAAADELLIKRLETVSVGEKIALARRASGRVVGALLLDPEVRVIATVLENPRLTQGYLIRALMASACPAALVRAVCEHEKWPLNNEVRIALLRNPKTPASFVEKFAAALPQKQVKELLETSYLPESAIVLRMKDFPRQ